MIMIEVGFNQISLLSIPSLESNGTYFSPLVLDNFFWERMITRMAIMPKGILKPRINPRFDSS